MDEQLARILIISFLPQTVDPKLMNVLDGMSMDDIITHSKVALSMIIREDNTKGDIGIIGASFATKLLMIASAVVYKAHKDHNKPESNPTFRREDGTNETMEQMLTRLSKDN